MITEASIKLSWCGIHGRWIMKTTIMKPTAVAVHKSSEKGFLTLDFMDEEDLCIVQIQLPKRGAIELNKCLQQEISKNPD